MTETRFDLETKLACLDRALADPMAWVWGAEEIMWQIERERIKKRLAEMEKDDGDAMATD